MTALIVTIFALELTIRVVDTIGAATINQLLWTLLSYLPTEASRAAAQNRKVQADFLTIRKELNATSSQDEFAKWAKLRRNHDKLLEQLEAGKKTSEASRSKFDKYVTGLRMLVTRVPQYALPFWYGKEPMFWLPYGWFPFYAEWLLSFPRAPIGSVSIVSWQLACTGVIALVSELIGSIVGLVAASKQKQKQPVKVPAAATEKSGATDGSSKKEL
ncbi:CHD5 domain-containing protein [Plectosphaerella cucumerina]|uniref:CHD5 domain-containing protein n=1 Tax=Plectosphaerella cucumerina TaxID=40658 RepID=A0A8K0TPL8_9PEZI|nr:CHD5 domain-containing protein [Plectosphaerella cucumerina]